MKKDAFWFPAPATADAALEQLAKVTHKHPNHMHLIVIPRLMTFMWRKMLKKISDLVFTIPAGSDIWPLTHFEPLIVGICLPLSRHPPWKLKGTPMLVQVEGVLRGLSTLDHRWGQAILRQLSSRRGNWNPCTQVWCGACYIPLDNGKFPVAKLMDEGGFEIMESSDED